MLRPAEDLVILDAQCLANEPTDGPSTWMRRQPQSPREMPPLGPHHALLVLYTRIDPVDPWFARFHEPSNGMYRAQHCLLTSLCKLSQNELFPHSCRHDRSMSIESTVHRGKCGVGTRLLRVRGSTFCIWVVKDPCGPIIKSLHLHLGSLVTTTFPTCQQTDVTDRI